MRIRSLMFSMAAAGMAIAPVAASAAPTSNPAAGLSISGSARAGTPTAKNSDIAGTTGAAGIFAIIIVAGIIAIGVIAATNDDEPNSP